MKIGYYPGCSMHATAKDYGESLSGVTQALGVELQEVPDWACCGASSAHVTNHLLGVALPARTLATAEEHGMDRIMTPCAACYGRLCSAAVETGQDPELKREVEEVIGHPLQGSVQVLNIVELLQELLPQVEPLLVRRLEGLKLACYYGCLLLRPHKVTGFDDPEQPESMEALVRAVGAQPVAWNKRVECCGAGFSLARTGSVIRLGRGILDDAAAAGADAVVVACPMCHSNLDMRQAAMNRKQRGLPELPVLYATQVVGLAMGLDPSSLGLQRHFVSAQALVERILALPGATPAEGVA